MGLEFRPEPEHAHRTKKEAEHQAALLVLQHLGGSAMCGQSLNLVVDSAPYGPEVPVGPVHWIDVHGDGGIRKRVVREGRGELPSAGQWVSGRYY